MREGVGGGGGEATAQIDRGSHGMPRTSLGPAVVDLELSRASEFWVLSLLNDLRALGLLAKTSGSIVGLAARTNKEIK